MALISSKNTETLELPLGHLGQQACVLAEQLLVDHNGPEVECGLKGLTLRALYHESP